MWKVMELNDYKSVGKKIPPCSVSVFAGVWGYCCLFQLLRNGIKVKDNIGDQGSKKNALLGPSNLEN